MRNPIKIFIILLSVIFTIDASAQCSISESLIIPDLTPVSANILVEGATNDDLSGTQGVCGIELEFEHDQVGDLTIELTSPSGQSVVLLGPSGSFGKTSFTDWKVLFLPCSNNPSPDAGFLPQWNNDQSWGILGDFNGSYHPFLGCLENFDTGTINGNWNIQIIDNDQFDTGELVNATIFFCDANGINCNACMADAGEFSVSSLNVCSSSTEDIVVEPSFPNGQPSLEYEYYYILRQGETIISVDQNPNLSGNPEGTYELCGLSILVSDLDEIPNFMDFAYSDLVDQLSSQTPFACADINENCISINYTEEPISVDLSVTICEGDSYEIGAESFTIADDYIVTIPQQNGCDSIYNLSLSTTNIQALISSTTTMLSCSDPEITLSSSLSNTSPNSVYNWMTMGGNIEDDNTNASIVISEPGTYTLEIIDGLCVSSSSIQILANGSAPNLTIVGGTITCANPTVNIDLESDLPLSTINWSGPNNFMSNDEDLNVDVPGVYTVTVVADNGCEAVKSIIINQEGEEPEVVLYANELSCGFPQTVIQVNASSNNLDYNWTGPNGFMFNGKNPVVAEPGLYEVEVSDPFGCSSTFSIEIIGDPTNLDYVLTFSDRFCENQQIPLSVSIADENAIITWTLPDGSEIESNSISTVDEGMFEVDIFSNGCSIQETFMINEDFSLQVDAEIIQSNLISCTDTFATLSLGNIVNEDQIADIKWFTLQNQFAAGPSVDVFVSGVYVVFITSENGCTTRLAYILKFENEVPNVSVSQTNITCDNNLGSITTVSNESLDYYWTGPDNFSSQDSVINTNISGNYCLRVINEFGCQRYYKWKLRTDTVPDAISSITPLTINCNTDSVTTTYNSNAYSEFSWTSSTGFTSDKGIIKIGEPGTYFLEAKDASSGCFAFDTIEVITDFTEPQLTLENQSFNCGQNSLLIEAATTSTNVTFSWEGPNGFMSNAQTPLVTDPGDYTVTVTGLNGCTTIQTVMVDQDNELPNIDADSSNDLDCFQTQSVLTGVSSTANATFLWKGPNNVFSDPVITVEVAGDYTFIVSGPNGCEDSIIVNVPFVAELPEFTALGDTLFCGDLENIISINEISTGITYSWTGPNGYMSSDMSNVVADPGMYIVTGIGSNNCATTDTAFVAIDNTPSVIQLTADVDTLNCANLMSDININSDRLLDNISWTGPNMFDASTQNISVDEGGMYTLTVIAENNCETILEVEVIQDIVDPTFTLEAEDINCDNTKATIELENDDNGATYEWTGPSYNSDDKSPVVELDGTYFVTVTGSNGCTSDQEISVIKDVIAPNLSTKNDTLPCDGSPINLFSESSTEGVTYQWVGPNGFDSVGPTPEVTLPGIYFIEVTGPNGCSTTESLEIFNIPIFPVFEVEKSNDIDCNFAMTTISAMDVDDDKSYEWQGPNGFTSTDISFETAQSGMYYLVVEGITGCITTDSVEIGLDTLVPNIDIAQIGKILCDVNEVAISAEGSSAGPQYSYEWSTEDGVISFGANSLNPTIQGKGTYRFIIRNSDNGCNSLVDVDIEEEESTLESLDAFFTRQTCVDIEDGMIRIDGVQGGTAPYRYAIEGISFSENNLFENLNAGDYMISVKDSFGCVLDSLVTLEQNNQVTVDLGDDKDIALGESVELIADSNFPLADIATIRWEPAAIIDCAYCLDFEFIPSQNMVATVFLTDDNGCTAEDQIVIRVDDEVKLYIPNIFTPNNDGINDFFKIPESPNVESINYFNVYDRWGSKVFEDIDFIPGSGQQWNGIHLGQSLKQGAYVYVAELVMVNGQTRIIKGNITLIR